MGWWQIDDPKTGKAILPQTNNQLMIGDETTDAMGDCLDKVNSIYEKEFNRKPQKDEVTAIFNRVANARGYKNLPADEG